MDNIIYVDDRIFVDNGILLNIKMLLNRRIFRLNNIILSYQTTVLCILQTETHDVVSYYFCYNRFSALSNFTSILQFFMHSPEVS